jgi:tRNA threonylcarbamoyl adenosine modification protein YeaZ
MSRSRLTLAIETSNPGAQSSIVPGGSGGTGAGAGVALGRVGVGSVGGVGLLGIEHGGVERLGVDLLGVEPVRPATREDDDLMPAVERLCRRAGVLPGDLRCIAVSIGPGGFTGLRVATATVKMLCEATGACCIAVPTASAIIRRASPAARSGGRTVIGLAWKREDAWRAIFEPGDPAREAEPARLTRLEEFIPVGATALIAEQALSDLLRDRGALPAGLHIEPPRFDAEAVLEASAGLPEIDPMALVPLYPREPEAVTKWRELKRAKG